MNGKTRKQALTEGVMAGVLFGTAAIFTRFVQELDSFSVVFWRLAIACLTLITLLVIIKKSFQSSLIGANIKGLLALSLFLGLHFVFFTFSVRDTTILNATVLVSTVPIFSIVISTIFLNQKPSLQALVSLTISFAGVFLIAYGEMEASSAASSGVAPSLKGDFEAILAALILSFYLNYGKKFRNKINILSTMLPIYAFAAVIVGLLGIPAKGMFSPMSLSVQNVLPLLGLGVLPTAIAHTLYFSSLSNLKSFETATMAFLEPLGATILGIVAFREVPAPIFILGAAFVLAGVFFVMKKGS